MRATTLFNKTKIYWRRIFPKITATIFCLIIISGIFKVLGEYPIFLHSLHAEDQSLSNTPSWFSVLIAWGIYWVFVWPFSQLVTLLLAILGDIFTWGTGTFTKTSGVVAGWTVVRDVCNMFFVVILLIIAFSTVLRIKAYNYQALLPHLIIMAVLINFSKTICGIFIDFSQVIMLTFVDAFKNTMAGNMVNALQLDDLLNLDDSTLGSQTVAEGVTGFQLVATMVFAAIMLVVMTTTILIFVITLLFRIVMLWFLVVTSPIAFLAWTFPNAKKYSQQWWTEFGSWLSVGPITAFFLWLSLLIITIDGSGGFARTLKENSSVPGLNTATDTANMNAGLAGATSTDGLSNFIVAISLLLASQKFINSMSSQVGGTLGKFTGKAAAFVTGAALMYARKNPITAGVGAVNTGVGQLFKRQAGGKGQDTAVGRVLDSSLKAVSASRIPGINNVAMGLRGKLVTAQEKEEEVAAATVKKADPATLRRIINSSPLSRKGAVLRNMAKKKAPILMNDTNAALDFMQNDMSPEDVGKMSHDSIYAMREAATLAGRNPADIFARHLDAIRKGGTDKQLASGLQFNRNAPVGTPQYGEMLVGPDLTAATNRLYPSGVPGSVDDMRFHKGPTVDSEKLARTKEKMKKFEDQGKDFHEEKAYKKHKDEFYSPEEMEVIMARPEHRLAAMPTIDEKKFQNTGKKVEDYKKQSQNFFESQEFKNNEQSYYSSSEFDSVKTEKEAAPAVQEQAKMRREAKLLSLGRKDLYSLGAQAQMARDGSPVSGTLKANFANIKSVALSGGNAVNMTGQNKAKVIDELAEDLEKQKTEAVEAASPEALKERWDTISPDKRREIEEQVRQQSADGGTMSQDAVIKQYYLNRAKEQAQQFKKDATDLPSLSLENTGAGATIADPRQIKSHERLHSEIRNINPSKLLEIWGKAIKNNKSQVDEVLARVQQDWENDDSKREGKGMPAMDKIIEAMTEMASWEEYSQLKPPKIDQAAYKGTQKVDEDVASGNLSLDAFRKNKDLQNQYGVSEDEYDLNKQLMSVGIKPGDDQAAAEYQQAQLKYGKPYMKNSALRGSIVSGLQENGVKLMPQRKKEITRKFAQKRAAQNLKKGRITDSEQLRDQLVRSVSGDIAGQNDPAYMSMEDALKQTEGLQLPAHKEAVYKTAAKRYLGMGNTEASLKYAQKLSGKSRSKALTDVALTDLKKGNTDNAIETAELIGDDGDRENALAEVALRVGQSDPTKHKEILGKIKGAEARRKARNIPKAEQPEGDSLLYAPSGRKIPKSEIREVSSAPRTPPAKMVASKETSENEIDVLQTKRSELIHQQRELRKADPVTAQAKSSDVVKELKAIEKKLENLKATGAKSIPKSAPAAGRGSVGMGGAGRPENASTSVGRSSGAPIVPPTIITPKQPTPRVSSPEEAQKIVVEQKQAVDKPEEERITTEEDVPKSEDDKKQGGVVEKKIIVEDGDAARRAAMTAALNQATLVENQKKTLEEIKDVKKKLAENKEDVGEPQKKKKKS